MQQFQGSTVPDIATVGYAHPDYAVSLAEFGRPHRLSNSQGSVLVRQIPGEDALDAMGCYPLFSCVDWTTLGDDLHDLGREAVSLAVVTDPFGDYSEGDLQRLFVDRVLAFKSHFVADLSIPVERLASKHHRYYAKRSLDKVQVEVIESPVPFVDEWCALYDNLVARHDLRGIKAFSREAFARQLAIPGMIMVRAIAADGGSAVAAHLWIVDGDKAYSHLAAQSELGYQLMAAYAVYWRALEYLSSRGIRHVDIGAGAGLAGDSTGGLDRFKAGWANARKTAYLCGRIFDRKRYDEISERLGRAGSNYFPAYRDGEFR